MHAVILFSLVLFQGTADQSSFNSYEVFLSPRKLPGTCAGESPEQFRNRTYTFRGRVYPSGNAFTLRNGKAVDRDPLGTVEWETSLVATTPVKLAAGTGTLLIIGANHVHGTGGATHVLVVECRNHQLTVWFEAAGEGIRDASFDRADQELSISRWIWTTTDAHCCPSKTAQERYRWRRPTGRFERIADRPQETTWDYFVVSTPDFLGPFRGHESTFRAPVPTDVAKPTLESSRNGVIGILEAVVSADGSTNVERMLRSSGALSAKRIRDVVNRWRFEPAMLEGRAIRVRLRVTVSNHAP